MLSPDTTSGNAEGGASLAGPTFRIACRLAMVGRFTPLAGVVVALVWTLVGPPPPWSLVSFWFVLLIMFVSDICWACDRRSMPSKPTGPVYPEVRLAAALVAPVVIVGCLVFLAVLPMPFWIGIGLPVPLGPIWAATVGWLPLLALGTLGTLTTAVSGVPWVFKRREAPA